MDVKKFKTGAKTVFDLKEEIIEVKSFYIRHESPFYFRAIYMVRLKNGLSSLFFEDDNTFVFPDTWYYDWRKFDGNFLVQNDLGTWQLISRKDGSPIYEHLFYKWELEDCFSDTFYKVYDKDGSFTFIRKKDGSFIHQNFFLNMDYVFDGKYIKLQDKSTKLYSIFDRKDISMVNKNNMWFKKISKYYNVESKLQLIYITTKNGNHRVLKDLEEFISFFEEDKP